MRREPEDFVACIIYRMHNFLLVVLVQLVPSLLLRRQQCDWPRTRIPDAKISELSRPALESSELVNFS